MERRVSLSAALKSAFHRLAIHRENLSVTWYRSTNDEYEGMTMTKSFRCCQYRQTGGTEILALSPVASC